MAVQLSRFELLPPIIQEKILGKISSLIDLLRLHATNRSIAATVESIWFKKIKKLSVHIAGSDDGSGGPNLINGQEIPVQKIISAFEYLWKRAPSIISLKVIGRLLENVDWEGGYDRCMLVVLRQLMVDTPRTIRELQITIDRRQYAPEAHNLHAIKHMQLAIGKYHPLLELQDILGSVSATLEKFEFFLHTDRGNHFPPSDNFASLARCSLLKKLVLENIFVDWETLQIICQDKTELSHIVIREDIYAPQPWYQDIYENHILGILRGIDANITSLHVDLSRFLPKQFNFPVINKTFPLLKSFTITIHRLVDYRTLQKNLHWYMTYFPNVECIRKRSNYHL